MQQQNFFTQNYEQQIRSRAPLALRMRPETLDEFVGQGQIVGSGRLLTRLIKADRLSSAVFYGPPGTGKTTLAKIIAGSTQADFYEINAVTSGKKEMTEVLEKAKNSLSVYGKRSILFIDEIHRFNKAQQDLLLPSVEEGLIILIGATTENPYFEINSPLLSRSTIFEFRRLTDGQVVEVMEHALQDPDRGFGRMKVEAEPDALAHLAAVAGGDARRAVRNESDGQVPAHLKDAHYAGAKKLGRGSEYRYPHSYPGNWVAQDYLPEDIRGTVFYRPTENGAEEAVSRRLERYRSADHGNRKDKK